MNINFKIPTFRLPCLQKGDLCFAPLTNFDGNPFILCCLPHLTEKEAWLLESHTKEVKKSGGTLIILLNRTFPSTESWVRPLCEFNLSIFVDPLKRLRRPLRLLSNLPLQRCESLIFDQQNLLKFRIFHEFNLRGLSTILTIAKTDMPPPTHLSDRLKPLGLKRNEDFRYPHHHQDQPKHNELHPESVYRKISEICA